MIKLYNTLTKKKEILKLPGKDKVGIYCCGPTVYDFPHIGNLRTFLSADFLVRVLEYFNHQVKLVVNITDIDDKIIAAAKKVGQTPQVYTKVYTKTFMDNLRQLHIRPADAYPKATEHYVEMKALIKILQDKGFAYKKEDGIYFDISKLTDYGRLSGLARRAIKSGARVLADNYDKDNPADFALWKIKEDRPGWHIECSAMASKYLTIPLDIHFGGQDLIFPHHENERAQTLAATGRELSRFWLHAGHLLVDGQKMSKSLGNYYVLDDVIKKGFSPLDFRYLCLTANWREPLNFTWESLAGTRQARLNIRYQKEKIQSKNKKFTEIKKQIIAALADNLNTAKALGILHQAADYNLWQEFDGIFQLGLNEIVRETAVPEEIKKLVAEREKYRQKKEYAEADKMRQEIEKQGFYIEDTTNNTIVKSF